MLPYNDHDYLFEEPLLAFTGADQIGQADAYIDNLVVIWRSQDSNTAGQEGVTSHSLFGELADADFHFGNEDDDLLEFLPTMMVPLAEDSVFNDALDSHNDGWADESPAPSPVGEMDASTQTNGSSDVPDFVWVEAKCKTPDAASHFFVEEPKSSSRKRKHAPEQKGPRKQKKLKLSPPCLPGTKDEVPLEHVTVDMVQHLKRVRKIRHFWESHAQLLLYRLLLGLPQCKTQPEVDILDELLGDFWRNFVPNEYQTVKQNLGSQQLPSQMRLSQGGFFTVKGRVETRLNEAILTFPKKNGVALPAPPLEELSPELLDEYRGLDSFRCFRHAHAKYLLLSVLYRFNDMSRAEKTVLSKHCYHYWLVFHNKLIC